MSVTLKSEKEPDKEYRTVSTTQINGIAIETCNHLGNLFQMQSDWPRYPQSHQKLVRARILLVLSKGDMKRYVAVETPPALPSKKLPAFAAFCRKQRLLKATKDWGWKVEVMDQYLIKFLQGAHEPSELFSFIPDNIFIIGKR